MARMHYSTPILMKARPARTGFTLLELAIVLAIVGLILGAGISLYSERLEVDRVKETMRRLDRVEAALEQYIRNYGTLPCPAVGNIGVQETAVAPNMPFGWQTCAPAAHTFKIQITGTRSDGAARYALYGAVPTKTIGLADIYASDAWDNRLMYVVDTEYSYAPVNPIDAASGQWGPQNGALVVQDYNNREMTNCGADCAGTAGGIYAVFSAGANGVGSWPKLATLSMSRRNTTAVGTLYGATKEQENSHIAANGGALGAPNITLRDAPLRYSDDITTYFDDILRWKTRLHYQ